MEETFFQKLQRARPADAGHVFLFLAAAPVALVYRFFRRELWLLCDNKSEARDNGWQLFKYICKEHPEIDAVYAIGKRSPDREKVLKVGKTVNYGSFRHWVLYLAAKYNISSQKGGKPNAAVTNVLETKGLLRNKRIFLQHGIIKDDMPWLHYKNTKMKMFVTSTRREQEFISSKFGYPEGAVRELGLCRFDNLHDYETVPRQVLLMPTWRSWIADPTSASFEIEDVRNFENTAYFKAWNSFLGSERLRNILCENDLHLIFYPHRDMQKYLGSFDITDSSITIAGFPQYDVQKLLKSSAFLITDYSSVAMDFAYMDKPLVYYQFDYEDFRRGQYPEGYFDYKTDGFGPVFDSENDVLDCLEAAAKGGFVQGAEYSRRHDEFFDLCDTENCRRNFEAIMSL